MSCDCINTPGCNQNEDGTPQQPCPDGYTLVGRNCVKESEIGATAEGQTEYTVRNILPRRTFGTRGTAIYSSYNVNGIGTYSIINPSNTFWINTVASSISGPFGQVIVAAGCPPWKCTNDTGINEDGSNGCSPRNCTHYGIGDVLGPVNRLGVWNDSIPVNKWVGFSYCHEVTEEELEDGPITLYVGVTSNYFFKLVHNGTKLINVDTVEKLVNFTDQFQDNEGYYDGGAYHFEYGFYQLTTNGALQGNTIYSVAAPYQMFHIFPVVLSEAGTHRISVASQKPVNIFTYDQTLGQWPYYGLVGMEVYDTDPATLEELNSPSALNPHVLFRSSTLVNNSTFNYVEYTCPSGYELVDNDCGSAPVCRYTETIPAILPPEEIPVECEEKDPCIESYPTDCIIYEGEDIGCDQGVSPYIDPDLVDGGGTRQQRSFTNILEDISSKLCYAKSRTFIKDMLLRIRADQEMTDQLCDIGCECNCDPGTTVYRPKFINITDRDFEPVITVRVTDEPNYPAPLAITLYSNNVILHANSDTVAVETPVNTNAVWAQFVITNQDPTYRIKVEYYIEDNIGTLLTPKNILNLLPGQTSSQVTFIPLAYTLPLGDDYNCIVKITEYAL